MADMQLNELTNIETTEAKVPCYGGVPHHPTGRARSALNAIKFSLTGRTILLDAGEVPFYQAFCKEIIDSYSPANPEERRLAASIADDEFRLRRFKTVEDTLFALGTIDHDSEIVTEDPDTHALMTMALCFRANSKDFLNLSMYLQRTHRAIEKNVQSLKQLQKERKAQEQAALEEAVKLHKLHKMARLPYDPSQDKFVFSSAAVAREVTRRERLEDARIAQIVDYDRREFHSRRGQIHQYTKEEAIA